MIIKNHLHKKGFALGLVLKQSLAASRKWPICDVQESFFFFHCSPNLVKWPKGTYALPMPDSGCPITSEFSWLEGYFRQDTEDTGPLSSWSSPLHLKGEKKPNQITQHFCVKTNKTGKRRWPSGEYCIYKKGTCPRGKVISFWIKSLLDGV